MPKPGLGGIPGIPIGGGLKPEEPSPLAGIPLGGKEGGNGGGLKPCGRLGRKGGNPPGGGGPLGLKLGGKGGRPAGGAPKGAAGIVNAALSGIYHEDRAYAVDR